MAEAQTVLRVAKDPPAYMALSQRSPETLQAPPTRRPHFCWGIEDFNVHRIFEGLAQMPALARSVLREGTTINGVNFDGPDARPCSSTQSSPAAGWASWARCAIRTPKWYGGRATRLQSRSGR